MDFNSILEPLQNSFIPWVNKYRLNTVHSSFCDLSNCQFFSYMLSRVERFHWVQQIQWNNFSGLQTSEKIKRLRIVGRSISCFYHTQIQISIDNLAFNYVQMCLANSQSQILKLVIAVVGVLVQSEEIKGELQSYLSELEEQMASLFRIMVDYAYKIGEKLGENGESPRKRQKKLISKLQSLQEEVQFYEDYVLQLESKIQTLNGEVIRFKRKNEQLKEGGDKLQKKVQNLSVLNDQLSKELQSKSNQSEILNQRLALNRHSAQQILDRLLAEAEKERQDANYFRKQLQYKNDIQCENKKLRTVLEEKQHLVQSLLSKSQKLAQMNRAYEDQVKKLTLSTQNLKTDNQNLSLKVQLLEKSIPINRTYYCSPEQQSIVYATKLGDSFLLNTPKQWFGVQEDQNSQRYANSGQSLTFSLRSGQSLHFPASKGYISIKELQNSFEQYSLMKQNIDPNLHKNLKLSQVLQQKSIQISQSRLKQTSFLQNQLDLAITTIFELYSNLQSSRKQLRFYQNKQAQKTKRSLRFAAKIQKMFA